MASKAEFLREAYTAARQAGLSHPVAQLAAAQAAHESNYGKSAPGNNFFGMKAGKSWKGAKQNLNTWEVIGGVKTKVKDFFRSYATPAQSFQDWAKMIARNWPGVLTAKTFEEAVAALKTGKPGGYATDDEYTDRMAEKKAELDKLGISYSPNRYEAPAEAELAPGPLPSNAPPRGNTLAEAYSQYGASRALAPEKPAGWTASPFRPDNIDIGGPNFMSAPLGRVERGPALAAPARLGMGGYTPPAPSPPAYGGPANRPMPSGRISVPAAPSALGRSLATRTKDDRVSITGPAPSALGRPGAQMSPNGANRTKDDNARSVSGAAPSALGTTIGRGGYSPPGSGFKAENVDRGLLGADPASSFRADNIDRSLTGANPVQQTSKSKLADAYAYSGLTRAAAPSMTPQQSKLADAHFVNGMTRAVAPSAPAAPAKTSPALAPDALERALAVRNELENIKDLSQTVAPASVLAPALMPPTVVQPRPVVVAPAPQAMPSKPVAPALRPSDIYSGTIGSALDNTGKNTVSRDAFGNTTVTNQWGATTGMTPGGYQTAYGSLPGIEGPSMGKIGGAVKGALPGIAGSTVGGLLGGPLGALLGAALAKAATQPGGILSGMQSFNTNAFGTINAAKAQGGGAFPDAPSGGYGSGGGLGASFSNRSGRDMDSISPGASAAIGRGQGGLY